MIMTTCLQEDRFNIMKTSKTGLKKITCLKGHMYPIDYISVISRFVLQCFVKLLVCSIPYNNADSYTFVLPLCSKLYDIFWEVVLNVTKFRNNIRNIVYTRMTCTIFKK